MKSKILKREIEKRAYNGEVSIRMRLTLNPALVKCCMATWLVL